jgi:hypothetical protein
MSSTAQINKKRGAAYHFSKDFDDAKQRDDLAWRAQLLAEFAVDLKKALHGTHQRGLILPTHNPLLAQWLQKALFFVKSIITSPPARC